MVWKLQKGWFYQLGGTFNHKPISACFKHILTHCLADAGVINQHAGVMVTKFAHILGTIAAFSILKLTSESLSSVRSRKTLKFFWKLNSFQDISGHHRRPVWYNRIQGLCQGGSVMKKMKWEGGESCFRLVERYTIQEKWGQGIRKGFNSPHLVRKVMIILYALSVSWRSDL